MNADLPPPATRFTGADDAALAESLIAESKSARLRNFAYGAAASLLALGLGTAAIVWAMKSDFDPAKLRAALEPIKVEVRLDPASTIKLADGGTVSLSPGGTVGIDPDARVRVVGNMPPAPLPALPPEKNGAIRTQVIVFKSQPHGPGFVTTGWRFPLGDATLPTTQFCYYVRNKNGDIDGADRDDISDDRTLLPSASRKFGAAEAEAMFAKCQWFAGVL